MSAGPRLAAAAMALAVGASSSCGTQGDPGRWSQEEPISVHVSPHGSDGGAGTADRPFRTIRRAAEVAVPGTTVHVAPGVYRGSVRAESAGSARAPIRFVSDTPHGALVRGVVSLGRRHLVFEGFRVSGPRRREGIEVTASDVTVRGNDVHRVHRFAPNEDGGSGIDVYTDGYRPLRRVTIDANRVHDIGARVGANQLVQGIYVSVPCRGCSVTNNLVYRVSDFGIHAFHRPRHWLVANNTVYGNGRGILTGPDFVVTNNISSGNRSSDYEVRGRATLTSNLSYGRGRTRRPGVKVVNPQLLDPGSGRTGGFRLAPTSPAVDSGSPLPAPETDYSGAGRPRGAGYDIGAYER